MKYIHVYIHVRKSRGKMQRVFRGEEEGEGEQDTKKQQSTLFLLFFFMFLHCPLLELLFFLGTPSL